MPLYQLFVISRPFSQVISSTNQAQKDGIAAVIKRTAMRLIESDSVLKRIEFMGVRNLPYRMRLGGKGGTIVYSGG